jgi:hypothetical protein
MISERRLLSNTCIIWRPRRRPICLRCPPGGRGVSASGVSLDNISGAGVSHVTPGVDPDSECIVEVPVLLLLDNRWQYDKNRTTETCMANL